MKDSKYYKKYFMKKEVNHGWLSKILICIIIILVCLIITNFSSDLREKFKRNVLEDTIDFSKINKVYDKYIGTVTDNDSVPVSNTMDFSGLEKEEYNGSYKFKVSNEYPVPVLGSGIIVYIGDKDEYKSTVIVQGNDGVDIWYSNILMSDYSLYDYVKKGDILGSSNNEEIIITIMKDGKKLNYEEYFK